MKTPAQQIVAALLVPLLGATLAFTTGARAATVGDDFNDNRVDLAKWGPDEKIGHGVLTEKNQRLEYTCVNGTANDDLIRRWHAGNGPYDANWEMQMDLFNHTAFTPGSFNQDNSFGIKLRGPTDDDQEIFVEMYGYGAGTSDGITGFHSEFETPGREDFSVDTGDIVPANVGAVRMAFDSVTKVVTVYYDLDPSDGYQWIELGSFGVAASGGLTNANWGMTDSDQFRIYIYGYSSFMNVTSGQVFGDNFQTTGLVGPPSVHDLAVSKITAPRNVTLTSAKPALTKRVTVALQNRGAHSETISDLAQFTNLVTLAIESLDTNACANIVPVFHDGLPQKKLPFVWKSKQKLNVFFDVTFDCAVDAVKGAGHEDFRYIATVHHDVFDGVADAHPDCDVCPRAPLPGNKDPNPNGRIVDKGCGAPVGNGTFGNPVLTDILRKE